MSDLIRVQCPKCGGTMKEKAKNIRGGFSMPCTHCATSIVFESESNNSAIRQALSQARRLRRQTPRSTESPHVRRFSPDSLLEMQVHFSRAGEKIAARLLPAMPQL